MGNEYGDGIAWSPKPVDLGDRNDVTRLFGNDETVRHQYEGFRKSRMLEGEKKLMLAILEDAIGCIQKNARATSGKGKRLFDEAMEWINEQEGDWLFSFESVCDVLGFNAPCLRGGIIKWVEAERNRPAKSVRKRRIRSTPHDSRNRIRSKAA